MHEYMLWLCFLASWSLQFFFFTYSRINTKTLLWRLLLKDCWFISLLSNAILQHTVFLLKYASLSCFQRFNTNISLLLAIIIDRRHCSKLLLLTMIHRTPVLFVKFYWFTSQLCKVVFNITIPILSKVFIRFICNYS